MNHLSNIFSHALCGDCKKEMVPSRYSKRETSCDDVGYYQVWFQYLESISNRFFKRFFSRRIEEPRQWTGAYVRTVPGTSIGSYYCVWQINYLYILFIPIEIWFRCWYGLIDLCRCAHNIFHLVVEVPCKMGLALGFRFVSRIFCGKQFSSLLVFDCVAFLWNSILLQCARQINALVLLARN